MDKFIMWYREYANEITWWVIGWLSFALVDCMIKDNWIFAFVDAFLIYFNYKLWKNNNNA